MSFLNQTRTVLSRAVKPSVILAPKRALSLHSPFATLGGPASSSSAASSSSSSSSSSSYSKQDEPTSSSLDNTTDTAGPLFDANKYVLTQPLARASYHSVPLGAYLVAEPYNNDQSSSDEGK